MVGGLLSCDTESSSVIGGAPGESAGLSCSAAGAESGRSSGGSSFLVGGGGDSWGEDLPAGGDGGGGSLGATSFLISGGESGGVSGLSGRRLDVHPAEEILGFGARGGLDLGRWTSSGVSLGGGVWGEGGGDRQSVEAVRGVRSDRLVLLLGFSGDLDLGRRSSSGVSLDKGQGSCDAGGSGEEGGGV